MQDKIYIIGHKSPDLDSVAAAISYANFKNQKEKTDRYIPATAGKINKVTKYVLDKFGFSAPEILASAEGKRIILVDHNEATQIVEGGEEAEIIEILDHHKMDFKNNKPINILVRPWGSSCSIIFDIYEQNNIAMDEKMAALMLSAVLDDTVITKSPTSTEKDKEIITKLSSLAKIADWREYGVEMFKIKSSVADFSAEQIIKNDYKDFKFGDKLFGVGQIETVSLKEIEPRYKDLLAEMEKIRLAGSYHTVILFLTDILKGGSYFLVSSEDSEAVAKAFNVILNDSQVYIPGIMSRKKQVAPALSKFFNK